MRTASSKDYPTAIAGCNLWQSLLSLFPAALLEVTCARNASTKGVASNRAGSPGPDRLRPRRHRSEPPQGQRGRGGGQEQGADLTVFPELSLSGYALGELGDDVAIEAQSKPIISLAEVAGEMGVVVGFCEEGRGFQTYNSAAYLEGGVLRHLHRKLYLPNYRIYERESTTTRDRTCAPSTPGSVAWPS